MTNKYTFSNSFIDFHGKTSTLDMDFQADNLEQVLDHFERFLSGCGFVLDGQHLELVQSEEDLDSVRDFRDNLNSYLDDLSREEEYNYHSEK